jgi:hypothetical protein
VTPSLDVVVHALSLLKVCGSITTLTAVSGVLALTPASLLLLLLLLVHCSYMTVDRDAVKLQRDAAEQVL